MAQLADLLLVILLLLAVARQFPQIIALLGHAFRHTDAAQHARDTSIRTSDGQPCAVRTVPRTASLQHSLVVLPHDAQWSRGPRAWPARGPYNWGPCLRLASATAVFRASIKSGPSTSEWSAAGGDAPSAAAAIGSALLRSLSRA